MTDLYESMTKLRRELEGMIDGDSPAHDAKVTQMIGLLDAVPAPARHTDEAGNFWTLPELIKDLEGGHNLYLTPKMGADLAKMLRGYVPRRLDALDVVKLAKAAKLPKYMHDTNDGREALMRFAELLAGKPQSSGDTRDG